jgi:hypothetical protein
VSSPSARRPGDRCQHEGGLASASGSALSSAAAPTEPLDERTGGADAEREGLHQSSNVGCSTLTESELSRPAYRPPGRTQSAGPTACRVGLSGAADRARAPRPRTGSRGLVRRRDPRQAATTPPRVTRAISQPADGIVMKWTTSCASAASNESSKRQLLRAGPLDGDARMLAGSGDERLDGSTAVTPSAPTSRTARSSSAGPEPSRARADPRQRRRAPRGGASNTSSALNRS